MNVLFSSGREKERERLYESVCVRGIRHGTKKWILKKTKNRQKQKSSFATLRTWAATTLGGGRTGAYGEWKREENLWAHLCVCVCVRKFVCYSMCVFVCMCMYLFLYLSVCMCVREWVCVLQYVWVSVCACVCVCLCACVCARAS